jgi:hypothetical protein
MDLALGMCARLAGAPQPGDPARQESTWFIEKQKGAEESTARGVVFIAKIIVPIK